MRPHGYHTLASYGDDGQGQIECPRKGLVAIDRCRQWQRETAEAGAPCTCPIYLAYGGGEPDRDTRPPTKAELRCGRAAPLEEVPAMTVHQKIGKNCDRCKKPSPDGTRVRDGLCKPCRDADASKAPPPPPPPPAAVRTASKVVLKAPEARPAPHQRAHALAHAPRQAVFPVVAECEMDHLRAQLAERDATIARLKAERDRMKWAIAGARSGHVTVEMLATMFGDVS